MRFPILRLQTRHKFVKQLKKFLNELVIPNPNLSIDDVFDERTKQAVILFKSQWNKKVAADPSIRQTSDYNANVTVGTWALLGRALRKQFGNQRLLDEMKQTSDYELRSLLMGLQVIGRFSDYYSIEMEICDAKIASIFGGDNAVAAANGFDPYSFALARAYLGESPSFYRSDQTIDGKIYTGHLSTEAMHLYGSTDGTRFGVDGYTFTDLYIPDGFRGSEKKLLEFKRKPGPNQASLDFYYPKLGNYRDVTLMVSHIKNFKLVKAGNRWHIGQIGGKGGQTPGEIHSHLDLFKGDVGMTGPRNRLSFAKAFCP